MIFITAKFHVLPEYADQWPEIVREFTEATRGEPGCLWFDWSRSVEDPAEYVLVEAFRDGDAGGAHVQSDHFRKAQQTLPRHLAETPGSSTRRFRRTTGHFSARWPCLSREASLGRECPRTHGRWQSPPEAAAPAGDPARRVSRLLGCRSSLVSHAQICACSGPD